MSLIKKLLDMCKPKKETEALPETFKEELNRLCNMIAFPISLLAIISWPIYIPLDIEMFPNLPIIVYLRWGFTAVGFISLLLYFTPFFKKRGYWLIMFIMYYLGQATAIILGLVSAHPSYMGGFAIVILICAMAPILRLHALIHLGSSLISFLIVSTILDVKYQVSAETYGLYNFILSIIIAFVVIYLFDRIRENSYIKSRLINAANENLQKANELKNQLLQVAAHDLKDPLQVIIGYTDLLQMKLRNDKFAADRLRIIYRSTDRMIKLIAGLLEITSIESGKLVMHKSNVDFSNVVQSSVKAYQQNASKKNQKLYSSIEEKCSIQGDVMLLRQVANNIIDNAVKFSPPGKSIWIALASNNNTVAFKVQDEGPGLEEQELQKIFHKFQRLGPKPTGGEISTGLGLAITKDLVELHQGYIDVESEPGRGTTFIIEFPFNKKKQGPRNHPNP
jgi:signal transduction histidine kinase